MTLKQKEYIEQLLENKVVDNQIKVKVNKLLVNG